jgi:hypothetical protein
MYYRLFILGLFFLQGPSPETLQKEEIPLVVEQIDAVLGLRDACVMPRYRNDFLCLNILDQAASCKHFALNSHSYFSKADTQLFWKEHVLISK